MNTPRFFNRSGSARDTATLGDKTVPIPKLTVAKWKALFSVIETLPQLIVSVLAAKQSDDFAATAVVGAELALDEAVKIVAVLAELDPEYIEQNADLNELLTFIAKTAQKNDLAAVAKNFRAVLDRVTSAKQPEVGGGSNDN